MLRAGHAPEQPAIEPQAVEETSLANIGGVDTQAVLGELGITMYGGTLRTAVERASLLIGLLVHLDHGEEPDSVDPRFVQASGGIDDTGIEDEIWRISDDFRYSTAWLGEADGNETLAIAFGLVNVWGAVEKQLAANRQT